MTKRMGWLDAMKLCGVYFVYVVHSENMGRYGLFFLGILLGVLFFASGYTASRHKNDAMWPYIKSRFIRIMTPYFAFGVLSLGVRIIFLEMTMGDIITYIKRLLMGTRNVVPIAAIWFLPCLLFMNIYYHLLQKAIKNDYARLAVCFAISVVVKFVHEAPTLPWGIDTAARFLIYYALGDTVANFLQRHPFGKWKHAPKIVFALLTIFNFYLLYTNFYFGQTYFFSLLEAFYPAAEAMRTSFPALATMQFIYEINGIWCIAIICQALGKLPTLCKMGQSTIVFCCCEQIVKTIVPVALTSIGLAADFSTPQTTLMLSVLFIICAYYLIALPVQRYLPCMLGMFNKNVKDI